MLKYHTRTNKINVYFVTYFVRNLLYFGNGVSCCDMKNTGEIKLCSQIQEKRWGTMDEFAFLGITSPMKNIMIKISFSSEALRSMGHCAQRCSSLS